MNNSDDSVLKVNVTSADGQVLLGNQILVLEDNTVSTFSTSSIDDFLKDMEPNTIVYHTVSELEAYYDEEATYNKAKPIAKCSIKKTGILNFLEKMNDKKMDLADFDKFLRVVRNYLTGANSLQLMDILTNFQIKKSKSISRQQDHQGNYSYCVVSEKGKDDFEFPKSISFSIPIIQNITTKIDLAFDFFFSWEEADGGNIVLSFRIQNIDLADIIEQNIKEIICAKLTEAKITNYFGTYAVIPQTNAWSLHRNELVIKR
jgi:hypothetical protein